MKTRRTPGPRLRGASWLLAGLILAACAQPAARGPQLTAGGRPIEVRGVNYIRPTGVDPQRCWTLEFGADSICPWDTAAIDADLDRMRALGVNTIRIFLNYYVFGGAREADPSYSAEVAFAHLEALLDAAHERGIFVMPVLLAKYPQDRFGPAHYETALDLHVRPVVRRLAGRPEILAWDLFNEPDIGSPVDERCWDWDNADFPLCFPLAEERMRFVKMLYDEVGRLDPGRPRTVSMAFGKSYFEPKEAALRMADVVDFYSFHYYDNEPYNSGRYAQHWYYGQGFPADLRRALSELRALGLEKPVVVSELGFPTGPGHTRAQPDLRRDLSAALRAIRDEAGAGVILWNFQETPEELLGDLFVP